MQLLKSKLDHTGAFYDIIKINKTQLSDNNFLTFWTHDQHFKYL